VDRLNIPADSVALARRARSFRRRPLSLDQEEAAVATPAEPGRQRSLDGYVPSTLVPTDKRMAALVVGGAPAWSRRLKRIDALSDRALADLEAAWLDLAWARRGRPAEFAAEWREHAQRKDFTRVNELIRRHNEHFPAEANLAMDVRSGDFIGLGGGDYRRQLLDVAWVLARFPTDLAAALEQARQGKSGR
jgi:hypothetical protein